MAILEKLKMFIGSTSLYLKLQNTESAIRLTYDLITKAFVFLGKKI